MCVCVVRLIRSQKLWLPRSQWWWKPCASSKAEREEALHLTRVYVCVDLVTDGGGREGRKDGENAGALMIECLFKEKLWTSEQTSHDATTCVSLETRSRRRHADCRGASSSPEKASTYSSVSTVALKNIFSLPVASNHAKSKENQVGKKCHPFIVVCNKIVTL